MSGKKTLMAGALAKNAELGSFGRFWTVLGGFGKCHPHYRVHIAGSLPLLHSPTDAIFQHRTPSAQDSEPKIAFSKRSIWAQMGPNGPNGLRPHFLRPHQSALEHRNVFIALNTRTHTHILGFKVYTYAHAE